MDFIFVSTSPLLVAASRDEFDAEVMLRFTSEFVDRYRLRAGAPLLGAISDYDEFDWDADVIPGPEHTGNWSGVSPFSAEFLTDDLAAVETHKRAIDAEEWGRAEALAQHYTRLRPGVARDGRPFDCGSPSEPSNDD